MIRSIAMTRDKKIRKDLPYRELNDPDIEWYWVDFSVPTKSESDKLGEVFQFHPLAIEDCFHFLQRPKLDEYDGYHFLVLHELNHETFVSDELDIFLSDRYVVTFHLEESMAADHVWEQVSKEDPSAHSPSNIVYRLIDKLVDDYFPPLYKMEDRLNEIEDEESHKSPQTLINEVFDIRSDLLRARRTIAPMRDLIYRLLSLQKFDFVQEQKAYFNDIYDHLLKLTEIVDSNRELTSDMRDSYESINSNRMNAIMMTLTIVSTIFIPLTFIAGVYGMNFTHMPELDWKYGYLAVILLMAAIALGMLWRFKRKGWFNIFK
ncbi:magnesium/cobalt transporter CorA [Terribacillus sp. 7520-G]|uniref:magnesium/cobalt transporter CorA n=1 Tax=Terribacillus TaxID=459532 RepID=UPI000BA518F7|nr:magnesium/cobalt transporter CorA [Terribacillus sp. 7520-G]PAD39763.1 magnesium and cobalt transport protein CorA [Terribacillus sp. 7520-G]